MADASMGMLISNKLVGKGMFNERIQFDCIHYHFLTSLRVVVHTQQVKVFGNQTPSQIRAKCSLQGLFTAKGQRLTHVNFESAFFLNFQ